MAGKPSCSLQCYSTCTCPVSCAACLSVELMNWILHQDCCVCHFVKASFACCLVQPGFSMNSMARNPYWQLPTAQRLCLKPALCFSKEWQQLSASEHCCPAFRHDHTSSERVAPSRVTLSRL